MLADTPQSFHSIVVQLWMEPIAASTRMNPCIAFGYCKRVMPLHVHGCMLEICFKVFHCISKVPPLLEQHNSNANCTAFLECLTTMNTCTPVPLVSPTIRMTCQFSYVNTWQNMHLTNLIGRWFEFACELGYQHLLLICDPVAIMSSWGEVCVKNLIHNEASFVPLLSTINVLSLVGVAAVWSKMNFSLAG